MNTMFFLMRDELFLGKGAHKVAYIHPEDSSKCIKIPYSLPDTDIERELKYRNILEKKHKQPAMLTKYYGTVNTDKGQGYVYELVRDYDGAVSKSLEDIFLNHGLSEKHLGVSEIEILKQFREQWLRDCIVTSDTDFVNYFVQKVSPTEFLVRIIDNIGTPAAIPLACYLDLFAKKRAKKYWSRLILRYIDCYCMEKDKDEAKKLL